MKVQKLIGPPTKVKLNTPQLTLAKLAQRGEHQTIMTYVPTSSHTGVIFISSMEAFNANIANFV